MVQAMEWGRCSISGAKRWGQKSKRERKTHQLLRSRHPCAELVLEKKKVILLLGLGAAG